MPSFVLLNQNTTVGKNLEHTILAVLNFLNLFAPKWLEKIWNAQFLMFQFFCFLHQNGFSKIGMANFARSEFLPFFFFFAPKWFLKSQDTQF